MQEIHCGYKAKVSLCRGWATVGTRQPGQSVHVPSLQTFQEWEDKALRN